MGLQMLQAGYSKQLLHRHSWNRSSRGCIRSHEGQHCPERGHSRYCSRQMLEFFVRYVWLVFLRIASTLLRLSLVVIIICFISKLNYYYHGQTRLHRWRIKILPLGELIYLKIWYWMKNCSLKLLKRLVTLSCDMIIFLEPLITTRAMIIKRLAT